MMQSETAHLALGEPLLTVTAPKRAQEASRECIQESAHANIKEAAFRCVQA